MHVKGDTARGETYRQLLARNGRTHLEVTGTFTSTGDDWFSMYAYSAVFAEVAVDRRLGLVRMRRMLGVYDVGRIISPKLADSQALGAMVGGIGQALLEHTAVDHRDGRVVNADLAAYLVPVNADVPDLKAMFLDGEDRHADPLGVKGLGEIVKVGVAPAIANAVFHATGKRQGRRATGTSAWSPTRGTCGRASCGSATAARSGSRSATTAWNGSAGVPEGACRTDGPGRPGTGAGWSPVARRATGSGRRPRRTREG
ncbi:nicotinate dehydrogenase medium molybdopterin subunit [Streptomyces scabiei]|uniref:Nicotinate dehydrogenase medium molybdopterin subunit n=1 Tax=Streptomyces scabiei TaxID=1930 RepID=A0A117ECC4_STRSC|nr:nicotinate dehydrogenase medium molybdopterin subunit [Streptomyces scabiei]